MKIKNFLLTCNLLCGLLLSAHHSPHDSIPNSSKEIDIENIDSLTHLWYNKQISNGNEESFTMENVEDSTNFIPDYPDSVYVQRLKDLPLVMEISYNKIVSNYIHMYTHKKRKLVEVMLGLSDYYFPIFEQLLDANNMPVELKYLAVIESALNPNAVSRVGATGIWQFMYYTGKLYKLEINSLIDERRDPIKATYAAINFMSDLYDIYDDWILVIAAYNCGPANVNKAIRRSGGKKDYWQIYYHLPRETRGYVPAFIAATYVMNYYKYHNIIPKKSDLPILCDTISITQQLHLEQVAAFTKLSLNELRMLNPQYRRDIIPGNVKTYSLRLPYKEINTFIDFQDTIFKYKDSVYFNPEAIAKAPIYNTYKPSAPTKNHIKLIYTVKSGDNLGYIAEWYKVKTSNLRYWNSLKGSRIRAGQKLSIYIHKSKVDKFRSINKMTFAEKQASIGKKVTVTNMPKIVLKEGEYEWYTVKRGDTLWDIAKLFPGVSETEIMEWNGISDASKISVGQKLKIKN